MKTSFTTRVMPERLLQKAIDYRKSKMAKNVVVAFDVNPAEKEVLEANRVALGRFIDRKHGSITFAPVKNGLFKGQTEMTVNKFENVAVLGDPPFTYKKQYPVLKHIIDLKSVSGPKELLSEIRKMINAHVSSDVKSSCRRDGSFPILKTMF